MSDSFGAASSGLPAVTLRLAREIGRATLDRVAAAGLAAQSELDQHVAAVRAAITGSEDFGGRAHGQPGGDISVRAAITGGANARGRQAAAVIARAATDARIGPVPSGPVPSGPVPSGLGDADERCPDAPEAADAASAEPALPAVLLLHYVCGFLEEAVADGWWPAWPASPASPAWPPRLAWPTSPARGNAEGLDWPSMRLAAACQLIAAAEAAAQVPPDLYL